MGSALKRCGGDVEVPADTALIEYPPRPRPLPRPRWKRWLGTLNLTLLLLRMRSLLGWEKSRLRPNGSKLALPLKFPRNGRLPLKGPRD